MKWGPDHADKHDLSSIRLLGSVGEPINPEAWVWYREVIGGDRVPVVDTWWQTETGMIMITPLPGVTTLKPGSATKPFPGVDAAVYDEQGNEVAPGGGGYLVLRKPWPRCCAGCTRSTTATSRRTGRSTRTRTSPGTALGSTRTATSGCSAAWTT